MTTLSEKSHEEGSPFAYNKRGVNESLRIELKDI
jgi:hypothetical protein